jgi:peptide deformylase
MIREIQELGNPVLRLIAEPISNVTAPDVAILIQDMLDTMYAAKGVGIAAPQIGVSKRLFIVASRPSDRYPHAPLMEPTAMANPALEWASAETEKDWEGCLSIPGLRALVPRSSSIRIRYTDPATGFEISAHYEGFLARVWLHENDHLNGVVFPDRVDSSHDFVTDREYRRIIADKLG